jgi:transaldolase/glucose-6-phosphate isomerase
MSVLESLREQNFLERLRDRDASLWSDEPEAQAVISSRLGWLDVHRQMLDRLDELRDFAEWVRENEFRWAVLLGMGGSSLAPEVLQRTFGSRNGYPELIVLDTTDPESILRVENRINIVSTLFIVSSKSGTTIETASLHRYFAERTQDATGDTGVLTNFVAVTDPGTVLHRQAEEEDFHHVFLNPPDIGGRYSALSMFGLAPAAAIGMDVRRLLEAAETLDWEEALELGARLGELAQDGRDKITFLAAEGLESFGAWAEQLLAESTGKRGRGVIPVDCEPAGPLEVYGDDRVFVYLDAAEGNDELDSGVQALEAAGHPVITTTTDDAYALGREFLRWEIATAVLGAVLRINPFDEPNVQESKDNTRQVLEEYARAGDRDLPRSDPAASDDGLALYMDGTTGAMLRDGGDGSVPGLVAALVGRAQPTQYVAIMAYIRRSEEHDRLLTELRKAVRDATRTATTVGYGPRFLHSTGQLHKGGPPTGIFLQITCEDDVDIDIPGSKLGFSVLKQSQALGDMQALQSRKRPVVSVHLEDDVTGNLRDLVKAVAAGLALRTAAVE